MTQFKFLFPFAAGGPGRGLEAWHRRHLPDLLQGHEHHGVAIAPQKFRRINVLPAFLLQTNANSDITGGSFGSDCCAEVS